MTDAVRSLYVHVPFCERKCEYCDFTSVAGLAGADEYLDALRTEIRLLGERLPGIELDTVFVGGGTPSLVDPEQLSAVLHDVSRSFTIHRDAEITMEANPSSVTEQRAVTWRRAGFNRISLGVQSLEQDVLRFLGRVHDAVRAVDAVAEVRAAGFTSINCDLIYAVPGLGDVRWRRTLQRVIDLEPTHVSCYELTVEPGTPLHVAVARGHVTQVDPGRALRQHRIAVDTLGGAGYRQYEVSNFARQGAESRHNLVYWRNAFYIAAGVGAHGHLPADRARALGLDGGSAAAVRYWHGRGIRGYVARLREGRLPIDGSESIDRATSEQERLMLGLRLREGVTVQHDIGQRWSATADRLVTEGLLEVDGDRARVTPRGEQVLNQVTLQLTAAADAA